MYRSTPNIQNLIQITKLNFFSYPYMKLKVIQPENRSEVTLSQYQRYVKLSEREDMTTFDFDKRKISIFTNIAFHDLSKVTQKDFDGLNSQIDKALSIDVKFKDRFKMNGIEFGFIPNLEDMSSREFVDLSLYPMDEIQTLHNLMAILFRPVTKEDNSGNWLSRLFKKKQLNNYDIETYKGTDQYKDIMKDTPMHIVNGALVFFWNLQKQLLASSQRYTVRALKKANKRRASLRNGDGMPASIN